MQDPWANYLKLNQSLVEGAVGMTRLMMESYLRLLRRQQEILMKTFDYRRAEDGHGPLMMMPLGPDLKDHYGRRARDIDVEKDV